MSATHQRAEIRSSRIVRPIISTSCREIEVLKLLADENFDNTNIRGLLRRQPAIDIICVQDTQLYGQTIEIKLTSGVV